MSQSGKKVVVLQSNYLPWKGYFDLISRADLFIFYDSVQFTKNDWRNRNKIKTPAGTEWISIPCGTNLKRQIREVRIDDPRWQKDHWNRISTQYSRASYFSQYKDFFEDFYLGNTWQNLSELNQYLIKSIAHHFLGLHTSFENDIVFAPQGTRLDRLLGVLKAAAAAEYISGPAARDYIDAARFKEEGIALSWIDYSNYPPYEQMFPPFIHEVSIIDLLFNKGPEAVHYISSVSNTPSK